MDRSAFAKIALEQLKKARPGDISILDEDRFHVVTTTADGKSSITSLSNYYDEYTHAEPGRKDAVFDRIAKFGRLIDGEETLDEIRVMLVPRIRPRRYFEIDAVQLAGQIADKGEPPKKFAYRPLAEHLGVGLAIDRPEHIEYIGDVTRFGVPAAELDEIALTNLKRMTKGAEGGFEELSPGMWLGHWGDEYAAERMLLPELFTELTVKGDPVCFIPGAERLYVVGSEDAAALHTALALVDERMQVPRSLLRFAFVLRDGEWQIFEPDGDLGRELGTRLCMHLADAYAVQKEALEATVGEEDEEGEGGSSLPFIASIMGIARPDGELEMTLATWSSEVRAYLPRAMVLAIGNIGGEIAMIPWEHAMAVAGNHLQRVEGMYPTRWETEGFPDEAMLAKLRGHAIDSKKRSDEKRPAPARSQSRARHIAGAALADMRPAGADAGTGTGSRGALAIGVLVLVAIAVIYLLARS